MSNNKFIDIHKARVHNLKSVSIKIPKNTITVVTGPSGSGKSSLAFDTIYVEGQRRYIESLSSYARQFLGQYQPPEVESITGLSPAIAIDQKSSSRNPRSTVGTITEIYDYMRVLFARAGTLYDPTSGKEIRRYTPTQIVRELLKNPEKTKLHIMAPIISGKKVSLKTEVTKYQTMGFVRAYIDGEVIPLDDAPAKADSFDIVIDRVLLKDGIEKRLTDSVEHALKLSNGIVNILVGDDEVLSFSEKNISPTSGEIYPDLEPRLFSFNSPLGACDTCNGIGQKKDFELNLMITDENISILDGAIKPLSKKNSFLFKMVQSIANTEKVDLSKPLKSLPKSFTKILFEGSKKEYKYKFSSDSSYYEFSKSFPGITSWFERKYLESTSEKVRKDLEEFMNIKKCSSCNGLRLNEIALSTRILKKNIMDLSEMDIQSAYDFFKSVTLKGEKKVIAEKLLKEIENRLLFLINVGLDYLTINRSASTLSGGESQRIRLATQIGSALSGVLYVLDEPSIGLHQRDNDRLIETLKSLRDLGNTVLVVEHDEDTMREADYIIDIGPGAGVHGGEIVAEGNLDQILKNKKSITAKFLSGELGIEIPSERKSFKNFIELKKAKHNNLKEVSIKLPLGGLVCITGVSGSGKSSLVHEVLVPAIKTNIVKTNRSLYRRSNYHSIIGADHLKSIIELDQSPIGRTPNSNPATYSGLFDEVRKLYAQTSESQVRGYKQGRFSFNVKGGRCEECEGNGVKKIEMHFLPDVYITCSECQGSRYNNETLSVLYKGKNIADILNMSIEEASEFFQNHKKMNRILSTMVSVGLGYIKLGQSATTLSGGEAQRLKLSKELSKTTKGHCLYVLDEPTTGLHFQDIKILLEAVHSLVDQGHSVLIIEHNLDVIKTADYIIDLGPEGGTKGGQIIAEGTPEQVAKTKGSYTGKYLKRLL
ncbi:UvrABC system protein A (UvrA protein) (Excinuclease ABC subunit A) [Halobacteriovorax marinus SJ]|uniref:UvrABC system protein A n=1 Tax=Halobacteriovorax marinus (strain ATCC BAA-682 / DSM 15412 / SJ) TaxID=862908 RepID=E1X1P2_HALMS|nr:excinuclease ABC subunit UvrA [Halobacteriovorax marinus]CBW24961.1 UvrABC system protein A (UvrA protein) (Excinuclease ABC subunit A) [Halobacteriovorax marinus SJ]